MEKSVIIIGGGIAGLAAGCYARMNGYRTTIFEMHSLPGGLCTAWEREGYVFDGCIHYLFGTGPALPFHNIWQELGGLRGRQVIHHDELMRVIDPSGRTFVAWADPDRLADHLKQLSPADAHQADAFTGVIRRFTRFDMSAMQAVPRSIMTPRQWLAYAAAMMPYGPDMVRFGMLSAEQFSARFKDLLLRKAFPIVFGWPEIPLTVGLFLLAYMHTRNAGFPQGASLEFARDIEQRYRELGGEIRYDAQVEKILVEDDQAVGVCLYNDEVYHADHVISCADGQDTLFGMLDGAYADRALRRLYDGHLPLHPMIQVSLGVKRDLSAEPHWATYLLDTPVLLAGRQRSEIGVKHYCFDPTLAPPGHSVVEVILRIDYDYWQRIYGRRIYDREQAELEEIVIAQLERIHPGIASDIDVTDVATPMSYERYTGNRQGSSIGWLLTRQTMHLMMRGMRKTLPGLRNFFMAGQWVEPGGSVPVVAMSGRNAVQLLCHQDGIPFRTETVS